uniref:Malic enzyme n=2 Tax=Leptocylindrus danicus TaxID=163516 RepID=A0A7S2L0D0_9STRA|mmetsp:Transcript_2893/g.4147  ORF Transcript_2893/g.4147 Transcript_2893/m.4147 type:complete len:554 (+) Transcript_2893:114-1775(+)
MNGNSTATTTKTGFERMKDPLLNVASSTPLADRERLKLRGLVPSGYIPLNLNVERSMQQLRLKSSPLEKYLFLQSIQDIDERLYYAILVSHTEEVMPIVYTPTVGEACQKFSSIYRGTVRGLFISLEDAGSVRSVLDNWPHDDVSTIVVTDGERILGLGDQGVNGMGIPIGKLALYTACAGIHPSQVLPVHIDVGTNNEAFLHDPFYLGLKQPRERGPAYDSLIEEFFEASQDKFGKNVLIQFEDFGNTNAFRLLEMFQDKATTFNDDIQGTASVVLGGLIASKNMTGLELSEHTFLFAGAGEAGVGIAELIAYAITKETGMSLNDARKKIFLVDSKGLVTKARLASLQHHKLNFAHDIDDDCLDLLASVQKIKPTALIGVSAKPGTFSEVVCGEMAKMNKRPVIFALSNPTSKAECTAEEAYKWTDGRAVFASGSPFGPVTLSDRRTFIPGQGNNAYVFPGIGLGAIASGATKITQNDMLIAARALADQVKADHVSKGCVYPPLSDIRNVSTKIAAAVASSHYETGVATVLPKPSDMLSHCKSLMYNPLEFS